MTHDEMIAVIQAHKEGKQIEVYIHRLNDDYSGWCDMTEDTQFNFGMYEYRVKPEMKTNKDYLDKMHSLVDKALDILDKKESNQ